MVYCVAPGCTNGYGSEKSFFSFPSKTKDPNRRKEWIKQVNRPNWKPSRWSRICQDHFDGSCFVTDPVVYDSVSYKPGRLRLKKPSPNCPVVPTIFKRESGKQLQEGGKTEAEARFMEITNLKQSSGAPDLNRGGAVCSKTNDGHLDHNDNSVRRKTTDIHPMCSDVGTEVHREAGFDDSHVCHQQKKTVPGAATNVNISQDFKQFKLPKVDSNGVALATADAVRRKVHVSDISTVKSSHGLASVKDSSTNIGYCYKPWIRKLCTYLPSPGAATSATGVAGFQPSTDRLIKTSAECSARKRGGDSGQACPPMASLSSPPSTRAQCSAPVTTAALNNRKSITPLDILSSVACAEHLRLTSDETESAEPWTKAPHGAPVEERQAYTSSVNVPGIPASVAQSSQQQPASTDSTTSLCLPVEQSPIAASMCQSSNKNNKVLHYAQVPNMVQYKPAMFNSPVLQSRFVEEGSGMRPVQPASSGKSLVESSTVVSRHLPSTPVTLRPVMTLPVTTTSSTKRPEETQACSGSSVMDYNASESCTGKSCQQRQSLSGELPAKKRRKLKTGRRTVSPENIKLIRNPAAELQPPHDSVATLTRTTMPTCRMPLTNHSDAACRQPVPCMPGPVLPVKPLFVPPVYGSPIPNSRMMLPTYTQSNDGTSGLSGRLPQQPLRDDHSLYNCFTITSDGSQQVMRRTSEFKDHRFPNGNYSPYEDVVPRETHSQQNVSKSSEKTAQICPGDQLIDTDLSINRSFPSENWSSTNNGPNIKVPDRVTDGFVKTNVSTPKATVNENKKDDPLCNKKNTPGAGQICDINGRNPNLPGDLYKIVEAVSSKNRRPLYQTNDVEYSLADAQTRKTIEPSVSASEGSKNGTCLSADGLLCASVGDKSVSTSEHREIMAPQIASIPKKNGYYKRKKKNSKSSGNEETTRCKLAKKRRPNDSVIVCGLCQHTVNYSLEWKRHIKEKHWDLVDSFSCKECFITFQNKAEFLSHLAEEHSKMLPFKLLPEKLFLPMIQEQKQFKRKSDCDLGELTAQNVPDPVVASTDVKQSADVDVQCTTKLDSSQTDSTPNEDDVLKTAMPLDSEPVSQEVNKDDPPATEETIETTSILASSDCSNIPAPSDDTLSYQNSPPHYLSSPQRISENISFDDNDNASTKSYAESSDRDLSDSEIASDLVSGDGQVDGGECKLPSCEFPNDNHPEFSAKAAQSEKLLSEFSSCVTENVKASSVIDTEYHQTPHYVDVDDVRHGTGKSRKGKCKKMIATLAKTFIEVGNSRAKLNIRPGLLDTRMYQKRIRKRRRKKVSSRAFQINCSGKIKRMYRKKKINLKFDDFDDGTLPDLDVPDGDEESRKDDAMLSLSQCVNNTIEECSNFRQENINMSISRSATQSDSLSSATLCSDAAIVGSDVVLVNKQHARKAECCLAKAGDNGDQCDDRCVSDHYVDASYNKPIPVEHVDAEQHTVEAKERAVAPCPDRVESDGEGGFVNCTKCYVKLRRDEMIGRLRSGSVKVTANGRLLKVTQDRGENHKSNDPADLNDDSVKEENKAALETGDKKSEAESSDVSVVEDNWGCMLCTYSSGDYSVLKTHVQDQHVVSKRFFCPQCSLTSHEYSVVEDHILYVHKDVTRVVLSRRCPQEQELVDALCLWLPRDMKWKNVKMKVEKVAKMSKFVRSDVNFSDSKRYTCCVCNKQFRSSVLIRRHVATHWKCSVDTVKQEEDVLIDHEILMQLFDTKSRIIPKRHYTPVGESRVSDYGGSTKEREDVNSNGKYKKQLEDGSRRESDALTGSLAGFHTETSDTFHCVPSCDNSAEKMVSNSRSVWTTLRNISYSASTNPARLDVAPSSSHDGTTADKREGLSLRLIRTGRLLAANDMTNGVGDGAIRGTDLWVKRATSPTLSTKQ